MNTKLFFFTTMAALTLAACSRIDNPVEERIPVSLSYSTVAATETRAVQNLNEGTFASGESIKVRIRNTGANEWTDYTYTTAAGGAMTAPDPCPYYPAGSQNIDIVAYYPATAGTSFSVQTDQTADASYKASDLMFASAPNRAKSETAVNLEFSHLMAKLNVNITAGQGVSSITGVSILNVKPTVSFAPATGEVGEATGTATSITVSNGGAALIPAQTINGGLLSIVTDQGTATYSVSNKAFAAGCSYTLNITVNLRAVGTTTEITGWTSEGTVTVNPVQEITNAPAGVEAVDLGIVVGGKTILWANMNVGAETESDYGTYFAWGETSGYTDVNNYSKKYFGWETYAWCQYYDNYDDGIFYFKLTKYYPAELDNSEWWDSTGDYPPDNKLQLDIADDAARANWGGSWRMPTIDELNALVQTYDNINYHWEDKIVNGHRGYEIEYLVNHKKIFLPAAGYRQDTRLISGGDTGHYWSSSLYMYDLDNPGAYDPEYSEWAYYLHFYPTNYENGSYWADDSRCLGLSVRPVLEL